MIPTHAGRLADASVDATDARLGNGLEISGEHPPERSKEGWASAAFSC
jgi:hypothetical protein